MPGATGWNKRLKQAAGANGWSKRLEKRGGGGQTRAIRRGSMAGHKNEKAGGRPATCLRVNPASGVWSGDGRYPKYMFSRYSFSAANENACSGWVISNNRLADSLIVMVCLQSVLINRVF